jgi:hypothetical protein
MSHGQAADYYNDPPQGNYQQQNGGYDQQYAPPQQPAQSYNQGYAPPQNMNQYAPPQQQPPQQHGMQESKMSDQPPTYGQDFSQSEGRQSFQQVFKVQKPKWNDLWAGILVCYTTAAARTQLTCHS